MSQLDVGCTIKTLPEAEQPAAAERAVEVNPSNRASPARDIRLARQLGERMRLAPATVERMEAEAERFSLTVVKSKMWPSTGVTLRVGFFDSPSQQLKDRILQHMNAWSQFCNVKFVHEPTDAQVRIAFKTNDGYWSYLGTDILSIPKDKPTMNLAGFTLQTAENEYRRVVRHETGHTLGFPHEHMRRELIGRLDRAKTIAYFRANQGWSEAMTVQQVLTPLNEASIRGTPNADQDSIMCYQLPGSITIDGQPIRGGADIDELDGKFSASLYPREVPPEPPKPPPVKPPTEGGSMLAKLLEILAAIRAGDWLKVITLIADLAKAKAAGQFPEAEVAEAEALVQAAMTQAQAKKK